MPRCICIGVGGFRESASVRHCACASWAALLRRCACSAMAATASVSTTATRSCTGADAERCTRGRGESCTAERSLETAEPAASQAWCLGLGSRPAALPGTAAEPPESCPAEFACSSGARSRLETLPATDGKGTALSLLWALGAAISRLCARLAACGGGAARGSLLAVRGGSPDPTLSRLRALCMGAAGGASGAGCCQRMALLPRLGVRGVAPPLRGERAPLTGERPALLGDWSARPATTGEALFSRSCGEREGDFRMPACCKYRALPSSRGCELGEGEEPPPRPTEGTR